MELPAAYAARMQDLLGEEFADYEASLKESRIYGLRTNSRKITPEQFEKISPFPVKRIPWIPNGFTYDGRERPAKHPAYFAGLYYLQEPSAMTPAAVLDVKPGERVLDLCAAPGGKSTELGARLQGKGVLVSNDISNSRAKTLLKNLELFGIPNSVVLCEEAERLTGPFYGYFDKILVDAPCSGEGMFRKEEAVLKNWKEDDCEKYAKIQLDLLVNAAKMLKPGGKLLYSTCTFSPKEDEGSVQAVLHACPDLHLVPIPACEGFSPGLPEQIPGGSSDLSLCVRIWPHRMPGEGHFLALLEKDGLLCENDPATVMSDKNLMKNPSFASFLSHLSDDFLNKGMQRVGDRVQQLPDQPLALSHLRVMRCGLLAGEFKRDRFLPSQALAMALFPEQFEEKVVYPVTDERVLKYLKGETIEDAPVSPSSSGDVLVCLSMGDGVYPLGFAKRNGPLLKNRYLTGWRYQ